MLKPSSLDVAAAETFCTTKICTSQDCNNERVSRIRIPVKNGFFPDRNESTNITGKFDVDSVTWTQRGTQRGIVSVQLRNFKQVCI